MNLRTALAAMTLSFAPIASAQSANYQGTWWGGPEEAGWNISFAHQGDVIFALWATYDEAGKSMWLSMSAMKDGPDSFSGTLYRSTVPPSNNPPSYDPARLAMTDVGTATIAFSSAGEGKFTYRVSGVERTKRIERFLFNNTGMACTWVPDGDLPTSGNSTDIYYSRAQPGSAFAIQHIPDAIFYTWFTYGTDGSPTWLYGVGFDTYGDYDSQIYRTTGTSYLAPSFDPASVTYSIVGDIELEPHGYGEMGVSAGGRSWGFEGNLERYVFRGKGTSCEVQR